MQTNQHLTQQIRAELALEPGVDIDDVEVEVEAGIVTLSGPVENLAAVHYAGSCVMRFDGVHAVVNQLSVKIGTGRMHRLTA